MAFDKHDLFELYKMATETDRYELELGWKLVQFFTVLNSGLMGLGFTLLGSDQLSSKLYIIPIFVVGILVSSIAMHSRRRYHERSLRASYKKTLIESELKLYDNIERHGYKSHNLAVSTSPKRDPETEILHDPETYIKKSTIKRGTVPFYHTVIFGIFIAIYVVGILISLN
jgi:hypothetical protein